MKNFILFYIITKLYLKKKEIKKIFFYETLYLE